ncbi:hypothetical protein L596_017665 [Steinernema carpocapsae]|uniref:Lipase domain-containing protein n=1 Tax=Steinernema carpocapsae TaxID=34508 RepID=A0A4U5N2S0_STECR|nr:hypothetical protein L596_017665 [Steinernema carpocapsae]
MRARASRRPQGRSNKSGSSLLASSSRVSSTPRVLRSSQNRARMFTTTKMIMRKFFFLFVLLLPYACAQKEGPKGPLTNDFVTGGPEGKAHEIPIGPPVLDRGKLRIVEFVALGELVPCCADPLLQLRFALWVFALDWLIANGYESENFERSDIGPNGSFGGRKEPNEQINKQPVIFIHGNGDAALHTQAPMATGFSRSIQYFLEQNYSNAELYSTTWGDTWGSGNVLDSYNTMHTCSYLMTIRKFVEAVIAYTGTSKVDIIAHSVGVPLARKALKGGNLIATDGNCSLGEPLSAKVDTFLGIAGPNYGLCVCQLAQTVPAWCNALDGLYPGYTCDDHEI